MSRLARPLLVGVIAVVSLIGPTTTAGAATGGLTRFPTGSTQPSGPIGIVTGPDGNIWITESTSGGITRMTPDGQEATTFRAGLDPSGQPLAITDGPDGNL